MVIGHNLARFEQGGEGFSHAWLSQFRKQTGLKIRMGYLWTIGPHNREFDVWLIDFFAMRNEDESAAVEEFLWWGFVLHACALAPITTVTKPPSFRFHMAARLRIHRATECAQNIPFECFRRMGSQRFVQNWGKCETLLKILIYCFQFSSNKKSHFLSDKMSDWNEHRVGGRSYFEVFLIIFDRLPK